MTRTIFIKTLFTGIISIGSLPYIAKNKPKYKVVTFLEEKDYLGGWGRGFCLITKEHPLWIKYKPEDIDIKTNGKLMIPGLITSTLVQIGFVEPKYLHWTCIGVDTYGLNPEYWTKERVQEETENIKKQLINYV